MRNHFATRSLWMGWIYAHVMAGRVLILAISALVLAIGTAITIGIATTADPDVMASMEDLREREVLFLGDHHIFLVFNDGKPLALSDDAQHLGDRVHFCGSSRLFESAAHGEKFDIRGYYFAGPAKRGLDRYPVRVEGDAIYVEVNSPIQGPERGEEQPLDPEGPFCVG